MSGELREHLARERRLSRALAEHMAGRPMTCRAIRTGGPPKPTRAMRSRIHDELRARTGGEFHPGDRA